MTTSARAETMQWIRDEIDDKSPVLAPEITARAVEHFSRDAEFCRRFFTEMFPSMVYGLTLAVMRQTRGEIIVLGDEIVSRGDLEKRALALSRKWNQWLEYDGSKHVRLFDMTRTDLMAAAKERYQSAAEHSRFGQLWERLASQLTDDERVSDHFEEDAIEAIYASLANGPGPAKARKSKVSEEKERKTA